VRRKRIGPRDGGLGDWEDAGADQGSNKWNKPQGQWNIGGRENLSQGHMDADDTLFRETKEEMRGEPLPVRTEKDRNRDFLGKVKKQEAMGLGKR